MSSINKRAKQTNSKFHLFNLEEGYLCHFQVGGATTTTGVPTNLQIEAARRQLEIIYKSKAALNPELVRKIFQLAKTLGKAGGIATLGVAGGLGLAGCWLTAYDAVAAPNGVYADGTMSLSARLGSDPGRVWSDFGAGFQYAMSHPAESALDAWDYSMKTGSDVLTGIGYTGVEAWNAVSGTAESAWNATSKSDFGYGWRGVAESWGEVTGLKDDPSATYRATISLQANQTLEVSPEGKIIRITQEPSGKASRLVVQDFITIRTQQGDVKIENGIPVLVNWNGKSTKLEAGPIVGNATTTSSTTPNPTPNPTPTPTTSPAPSATDTCPAPIPAEQAERLSQEIKDTIDKLGTEAEALKGKLKDLLDDIKGKGVKADDLTNIADIFKKDAAVTKAGSGGPIFLGLQVLLGEMGFSQAEVKQLAQSIMNAMSSAGTVQKALDDANTKQGEIVDELVNKVKEPLNNAGSNCEDLSKRLNKTKLIQKATRKLNGLLAKIPLLGWIAKIPESVRTIIITVIVMKVIEKFTSGNQEEKEYIPTLKKTSPKPSPNNT